MAIPSTTIPNLPAELSRTAPRTYVALAGSAGSLKALQAFFDAAGTASDLCFVVATHRGADHDGLLAELLANHTDMPVQQLVESTPARAGRVYLIPPDQDLAIENGQ